VPPAASEASVSTPSVMRLTTLEETIPTAASARPTKSPPVAPVIRDPGPAPQPRPQPAVVTPSPPPVVADTRPPRAAAAAQTGNPTRDAQRALESGDTAKAIDYARQATSADPTNTVAWLTLGAAYEASGRAALARTAYRNCAAQGRGDRVAECRALLTQ
jgi:hypothetical protein